MKLTKLNINPKSDDFISRYERAKAYLQDGRVKVLDNGQLRCLEVRNGKGYGYFVLLSKHGKNAYCSCPDFQNHRAEGKPCKHILAGLVYINNLKETTFGIKDEDGNRVSDKTVSDAMAEEREAESLREMARADAEYPFM